ncbi:CRISPR-associated CARF protein Csx1 [Ignisphaera sp. 4213-co]|uniref:CRISPR-associated CARF protein Csx1 n=1 Tax=Ignisphaera cupida TaxID=3050454 RepID=A0ABD4Z9Z8_9CREN|nr:CRISPR-associated CARF protein Csx1 [Ignisphaera sp. 4213-co]MDK6029524.1 CRISPR-associated CARF protein Csx1 [Ignisphaera sp. 4213-co]
MRLLVSVFGNPWRVYPDEFQWDVVEYVFDGEVLRSRTALPLLFKVVEPDAVLVVVQDSLIFGCGFNCYGDIVKSVEGVVKSFVESVCGECLNRVEVVVAPAIGTYKNSFRVEKNTSDRNVVTRFCGSLNDFYAYVLTSLYKTLKRFALSGKGEEIEIHLDLTHGVNYMPTMVYKAVRDVSSLLASVLNTSIHIYNSDPYVKNVTTRLNINKLYVEKSVLPPTIPINQIQINQIKKVLQLCKTCVNQSEYSSIGKEIGDENFKVIKILGDLEGIKRLLAFASSIVNGFPLLAFYTQLKTSFEEFFERLAEAHKSFIHVESRERGCEVIIRRRAEITKEGVEILKALMLADIVKNMKSDILAMQKNDLVPLEAIEKLASEETGLRWGEKTKALINTEIYAIKKAVNEMLKQGKKCSLLSEIIGVEETKDEESKKRNFYAHAGFRKEITKIYIENGKPYLKYTKDGLDEAIKHAIELLK